MQTHPSLRFLLAILVLPALVLLPGCGRKARENHLRLGVIGGPEEQLAEIVKRLAKERHGLDVEIVTFSDYIMPNAALADGSLDANAFQHRPFLDRQISDRGYKLVVAGNTFVYPIAGYSLRIKSLDALPDGAKVAVPNDPTNLGRALVLLAKQGLVTLKPGAGINATVLDIAGNPKKLKIVELEAAQLPRTLPDVDLAVINTTYAGQIGLSPTKDGLFVEDKDSPYVNLIVVREDNKDSPAVRTLVQTWQTDEVLEAAEKIFPGGVVKGW
ncbi:lipoprotein, YaeC family [Opitutaceae bacterium TAV1]|nr:methionine ABC transporter substrate-binding protein [Opitutaceae bacterium TAV5]EIQ01170.1 lipoprotein, YaeC family [Opitutaceae bacterium TAV1]